MLLLITISYLILSKSLSFQECSLPNYKIWGDLVQNGIQVATVPSIPIQISLIDHDLPFPENPLGMNVL